MRNFILILFLEIFISNILFGQTSFENTRIINYKTVPIVNFAQKETYSLKSEIRFKHISDLKDLVITFSCTNFEQRLFLKIYRNKKLIQSLPIKQHSYPMGTPDKALLADFNNDGRLDIKLIFPNSGCGLAASKSTKVYLFQLDTLTFDIIEFFDYAWVPEYDIDNDGFYENISTDHVWYNQHNYWVFNTYNYSNKALINTSEKYNYPLWTRHLNFSNNKIANNIPIKVRRKYRHPFPILADN